jgi:hypothetical protein
MWVSRRHLSRLCVRGHFGPLSLSLPRSLQVSRGRVPVTNSEKMRIFPSVKNNEMLVRTLHSVKQLKFIVWRLLTCNMTVDSCTSAVEQQGNDS